MRVTRIQMSQKGELKCTKTAKAPTATVHVVAIVTVVTLYTGKWKQTTYTYIWPSNPVHIYTTAVVAVVVIVQLLASVLKVCVLTTHMELDLEW